MKLALGLLFFCATVVPVFGQDVDYLLKEGAQLEKEKKDEEALRKYQEALEQSPNNLKALCKSSELSSLVGNRQTDKKSKLEYFDAAHSHAIVALREDPKDAEANFAMAFAISHKAMLVAGKERVQFVKEIKTYGDLALAADPGHYKALHLVGRWNMEVSSLNVAEKAALKVLFGGLPAASVGAAIEYFEKSKAANPNFILNYLDLAKAYKVNSQSDKAIEVLNRMLKLPPRSVDDADYKAEGKKLLESLL